jgi:PPOX class probable F420-dependent enzyme
MKDVPASHRDLLDRPLTAVLTTLMPDGYPQSHPVWCGGDGPDVLVNTMRGFRKERNMRADPRVTLLLVAPDPGAVHWVEIRGLVELDAAGALEHLDGLAERYAGARPYFGEVVPAELAMTETPVIGRIHPVRVVTDTEADARSAQVHRCSSPPGASPVHTGSTVEIPMSHRDLLARPLRAALSTRMPDGHPQTQPVWCDLENGDVLVNTTRERQKGRNLERDPRATVLVIDPADSGRWIEVRGDVSVSETGALEHLDRLTRSYVGRRYYGGIVPIERRDRETRILCRLHPRRVVCDAIH